MENINLEYTFEKIVDGGYQVRLNGEYVGYSKHKDSEYVDNYIKSIGYESREEFWSEVLTERG